MLHIIPIPAFEDNYIWLLHDGTFAVVVDPGDAAPVMEVLHSQSLSLIGILITHHHADHIGGVSALLKQSPHAIIYAPLREGDYFRAFDYQALVEGDEVTFPSLQLSFNIMETPGHTLGHIVYYAQQENLLFCGDTLFGAGCGRLFEGSPEQMLTSLKRLAKLPRQTKVYCTHEYTEHNIKFALMLDANNQNLLSRQEFTQRIRLAGEPSLPSSIELELETNPFLRCHTLAIQNAAKHLENNPSATDELSTFTKIRNIRNHY